MYNKLRIVEDKCVRISGHVPFDMCTQQKTQVNLRIRAVWSEFSLSAGRNVAFLAIQNKPSEDTDQTARMRRLIWIFTVRYVAIRCDLNTFYQQTFHGNKYT